MSTGHGGRRENSGRRSAIEVAAASHKGRRLDTFFVATQQQTKRRSEELVNDKQPQQQQQANTPPPTTTTKTMTNLPKPAPIPPPPPAPPALLQGHLRQQEEGLRRLAAAAELRLNGVSKQSYAFAATDEEGEDDDSDYDYETNSESDDDYDYDVDEFIDEGDLNNEINNNTNTKHSQINMRNRGAYKPPSNSTLGTYLATIREKVNKAPFKDEIDKGRHWEPPYYDPLSHRLMHDPREWYKHRAWVFYWLPFRQYKNQVALKDFSCIHCASAATLESKAYDYRPMIDFEKDIWCLHRRLKCTCCKRTFAEIDPRFISQLPTTIVEMFPFLTTVRGPGLSQMVLYHFMELATKGVSFGMYASSVNHIRRLQHSIMHCNYLDRLSVWNNTRSELDTGIAQPFAPFFSLGEYNGIELKPRLLKTIFFRTMRILEPYIQTSFQVAVDDGASGDHTFKYASGIKAPGKSPGQIFYASYTVTSLQGLININRLTYTKSNAEIDPVIKLYRDVRLNVGQEKLKRYESDGGMDKSLWTKYFPELNEDVRPYVPEAADGLIQAIINETEYIELTSVTEANHWALLAINSLDALIDDKIYFGLDSEWNIHDGSQDITRLVQVKFPDEIMERTAIFNLNQMGCFETNRFPKQVRRLLQHHKLIAAGINIGNDAKRLDKMGVKLVETLDLAILAKSLGDDGRSGKYQGFGMKALCARYLKLIVSKHGQDADYSSVPLPHSLAQYAALDAKLSYTLARHLIEFERSKNPSGPLTIPDDLNEGKEVDIFYASKTVARGRIEYIGKSGRRKYWGSMPVGNGKAIVCLEEVYVPGVLPPFSFHPSNSDKEKGRIAWDKKNTTLKQILESGFPSLVFPAVRLKLSLGATAKTSTNSCLRSSTTKKNHYVLEFDFCPLSGEDHDNNANSDFSESARVEEIYCANFAPEVASPLPYANPGLEVTNCTTNEEEVDDDRDVELVCLGQSDFEMPLRSREKSDIFHIFQNLPLPRVCSIRPILSRLLVHATFVFDADDFESVSKFLASQKGLSNQSDILKHFYFNREWWRTRVRMYTPPPEEHAERIEKVREIMLKEEDLRKFYTNDMGEYFDSFINKCKSGAFQEVPDIQIFQWDGQDANGLDLWLRKRGSTRAENIHQKMRQILGPWGYGARCAHYLLVLLCFKYNVNAGVCRCNAHVFGHCWLHYIDRIQIRCQEIFGVDIYPRHKNISLIKPVDDFVAVGIGPLWFSDDYVEKGQPDPHLTEDAKFLAQKMHVRCAPQPPAYPSEFKIINDYLKDHPKPKDVDWRELAKIFKSRSDCKAIFPKLPTMLKQYFKQWKETNWVKAVQSTIAPRYGRLLNELATVQKSKDDRLTKTMQGNSSYAIESGETGLDVQEMTDPLLLQVAASMNPLPVPPAAAPMQSTFIQIQDDGNQSTRGRRCFWFPYCEKLASECGGSSRQGCVSWKKKLFPVPSLEELFTAKKRAKNQRDAEKKRQKRQKPVSC